MTSSAPKLISFWSQSTVDLLHSVEQLPSTFLTTDISVPSSCKAEKAAWSQFEGVLCYVIHFITFHPGCLLLRDAQPSTSGDGFRKSRIQPGLNEFNMFQILQVHGYTTSANCLDNMRGTFCLGDGLWVLDK